MPPANATATLTVLVENCAAQRGVLGEHGWSVWIETRGVRILMDGGQGLALRHNAEALGVSLHTADVVVLSHGHYDHADGLWDVRDQLKQARLFAHPAAFQQRYAASSAAGVRPVGSTLHEPARVRRCLPELCYTETWTEVAPRVFVTGQIPRNNDFENAGDPFFLDEALERPDPLVDDQALVVETERGLAVILGCGHAGVANTLDHATAQTGERRFHLVLGGMHLRHASPNRIRLTVDALRRHRVERVGPAHCTGLAATAELMRAWGNGFVPVGAGSRVRF
jgi:7,8-dihydropterin-6-yl-methyl-4-(beta-D-ribofuranosyl)aminobenzene 5'-phosphate synthase